MEYSVLTASKCVSLNEINMTCYGSFTKFKLIFVNPTLVTEIVEDSKRKFVNNIEGN